MASGNLEPLKEFVEERGRENRRHGGDRSEVFAQTCFMTYGLNIRRTPSRETGTVRVID